MEWCDHVATRLLVLGVVRGFGRAHGYLVNHELQDLLVKDWANIRSGSIYHALKQMTKEGLLRAIETDAWPGRIDYEVSEKGEEDFLSGGPAYRSWAGRLVVALLVLVQAQQSADGARVLGSAVFPGRLHRLDHRFAGLGLRGLAPVLLGLFGLGDEPGHRCADVRGPGHRFQLTDLCLVRGGGGLGLGADRCPWRTARLKRRGVAVTRPRHPAALR